MSVYPLAFLVALALLAGSVSAMAQQRPRVDILTGQPVKPRGAHPQPEPEIFNAPHAPPQEQRRADDPPIEVYVAPQMNTGTSSQDQFSPATGFGPLRSRQMPRFDPNTNR